MNHVLIEPEQCKGCKLCVKFCPKQCIAMGVSINKMGYQYAVFQSAACAACGICYYVCPEAGAITVFEEKETADKNG
jgi:NAD-dependent dihydropyrimidine dehydrogenase PreA subunit